MKSLAAVLIATGFACVDKPANAQDAGATGIQGYVSVGTGFMPDYVGASKYVIVPYLDGQANLGKYFLRFDGGAFQLNVLDNDHFHAGPLMGYRMGRGDVYSRAVSRMSHIRYSITDGGFIEYEYLDKDPRSGERLTLTAAEGNINRQSGLEVGLRAMLHRPLEFVDPGLIAAFEVDGAWGDGSYMATYFGVDRPDSVASALPYFRAHTGIENVGAALSIDQFLSPKWSVGLRMHYSRLLDDAAFSPVTAVAGSPNQLFGGLVLGYVL